MLAHPLEENYKCLAFAILHRISCNRAWLAVTGERIGDEVETIRKIRKIVDPKTKKKIYKLRDKGWTYKKIGDKFDLSDSTVCTICIKHAKETGKHTGRLIDSLSYIEKKKIVELRKTMTLDEIAKMYNSTNSIIYNIEIRTREQMEIEKVRAQYGRPKGKL